MGRAHEKSCRYGAPPEPPRPPAEDPLRAAQGATSIPKLSGFVGHTHVFGSGANALTARRHSSMAKSDPFAAAAAAVEACEASGAEAEAAKKAAANKKKREKSKAKKAAAKSELIFEVADVATYLTGERQIRWWAAYQEAFKEEHEWMEARNQSTSRSMPGCNEVGMAALIFHASEPQFTRLSFFARRGGEAQPCAYATVDVDTDPEKVCHLRMLLVEPARQRQGIGLALLKFVVAHFAEHGQRQLGLKYARVHDYHGLYSQVGFKRIGGDDHFVYMAIGRLHDRAAPKPRNLYLPPKPKNQA